MRPAAWVVLPLFAALLCTALGDVEIDGHSGADVDNGYVRQHGGTILATEGRSPARTQPRRGVGGRDWPGRVARAASRKRHSQALHDDGGEHLDVVRPFRGSMLQGNLTSNTKGGDGGAHHSVFELGLDYIDTETYWRMMCGMIMFTIFVDRCQALGEEWAEWSPVNKMMWARITTELMMFGIVAVSIFVVTNLWDEIPSHIYLLVEFVDILCSIGCCSLICVSGILLGTVKLQEKRWTRYERWATSGAVSEHHDEDLAHHGDVQHTELSRTSVGAAEYKAMVTCFKKLHSTPKRFHYDEYQKIGLARISCSIMAIRWPIWLMLLALNVFGYVARLKRGPAADSHTYILHLAIVHWSVLWLHAGIMVYVDMSCKKFLALLANAVDQDKAVPNFLGEHWAHRMKLFTQLVAVTNAFLLALFLMNDLYILHNRSFIWYVVLLLPVLSNALFSLPFIVSRISMLEVFYVMDPEYLDVYLTELSIAEEDLRYMRERWKAKGEPFMQSDRLMTLDVFIKVCQEVGIALSEKRAKRIFAVYDADSSGDIDPQELLEALSEGSNATPRDRRPSKASV